MEQSYREHQALLEAIEEGRAEDAERLARESRDILPPAQRPQTEPVFIAQLMLIATDLGVEPPEIAVARKSAIGAHPIAGVMMGRYDLETGDMDRARAAASGNG